MSLNIKAAKYVPSSNKIGTNVTMCFGLNVSDVEVLANKEITNSLSKRNASVVSVTTLRPDVIPASENYKEFTKEELIEIRLSEAKKAATLGRYQTSYILNYDNNVTSVNPEIVKEYAELLVSYAPKKVITHSPFENDVRKVAVFKMVLQAIMLLKEEDRPQQLIITQENGSLLPLYSREELYNFGTITNKQIAKALVRVYDSIDVKYNKFITSYDLMPVIKTTSNFDITSYCEGVITKLHNTVINNLK